MKNANWGVQIAGMIFQTYSRLFIKDIKEVVMFRKKNGQEFQQRFILLRTADVRCGRDNDLTLFRKLPGERFHQRRLSAAADDGRHAAADVQKRCDLHIRTLSAAVRRGARGARSSPPRC